MFESRIGYWVKLKDVKLKRISNELNVSYQTVSNWCTGRSHPNGSQLFYLAKLLDVSVLEMYVWVDDEK
ncbi:helix-turn-helix domain-containing protein [Heyndrickxia sporothermodurans]|uniref:helix-turn-helix domain-containing protein n=1 Tax=Heyndrickxia sporothermodurans TaxID=46224 RepID=UPI002DB87F6F|nr:helix-turn-helix transcriptional regulator [Heyndrickxia sporothermodurans]MEB6549045.1 helix-turn-helix domain-containing protein [Heyndrickxia sporothermodurans]